MGTGTNKKDRNWPKWPRENIKASIQEGGYSSRVEAYHWPVQAEVSGERIGGVSHWKQRNASNPQLPSGISEQSLKAPIWGSHPQSPIQQFYPSRRPNPEDWRAYPWGRARTRWRKSQRTGTRRLSIPTEGSRAESGRISIWAGAE